MRHLWLTLALGAALTVTSARADEAPAQEPSALPAATAEAAQPLDCDASLAARQVCAGLEAARAERWAEAEATLTSARLLDDPILAARALEIDAALASARTQLGSVEVRCTPAGATIAVDGEDRGLAPLDRPLRLTRGPHTLTCHAPDHVSAEQPIEVQAGALTVSELHAQPIDRRPVLERVGDPGEGQRVVGISVLSLGGVSLAVGLGTLLGAFDASGPDRETLFDVARATLIAGGVAVLTGLVLVLTAE